MASLLGARTLPLQGLLASLLGARTLLQAPGIAIVLVVLRNAIVFFSTQVSVQIPSPALGRDGGRFWELGTGELRNGEPNLMDTKHLHAFVDVGTLGIFPNGLFILSHFILTGCRGLAFGAKC